MKRTVFFLFVFCCFNPAGQARDDMFRDQMIGSTFRALATAYVSSCDLEAFRKYALPKIESMNVVQCGRLYAHIWPFLKDLPEEMKKKYGFIPMTQGRMIVFIKTMQKRDLYNIIDNISDRSIAREFYWCVQRIKSAHSDGDITGFMGYMHEAQQMLRSILDDIYLGTGKPEPAAPQIPPGAIGGEITPEIANILIARRVNGKAAEEAVLSGQPESPQAAPIFVDDSGSKTL